MSFNANTVYPAVDINTIANQCKEAINADTKCFIVFDYWGNVQSLYRDRANAEKEVECLNFSQLDGYFFFEEHPIH